MQELLLTIVFDLEDELGDPEPHTDPIYDGFIEFLKDDAGFSQQDVHTDVGHHTFPDGDSLVVIQGKLKSWNEVDYVNDDGNRTGLEMDLRQAATANLPGAFLNRCDVQVGLMVEPEVTDAEVAAAIEEAEAKHA